MWPAVGIMSFERKSLVNCATTTVNAIYIYLIYSIHKYRETFTYGKSRQNVLLVCSVWSLCGDLQCHSYALKMVISVDQGKYHWEECQKIRKKLYLSVNHLSIILDYMISINSLKKVFKHLPLWQLHQIIWPAHLVYPWLVSQSRFTYVSPKMGYQFIILIIVSWFTISVISKAY